METLFRTIGLTAFWLLIASKFACANPIIPEGVSPEKLADHASEFTLSEKGEFLSGPTLPGSNVVDHSVLIDDRTAAFEFSRVAFGCDPGIEYCQYPFRMSDFSGVEIEAGTFRGGNEDPAAIKLADEALRILTALGVRSEPGSAKRPLLIRIIMGREIELLQRAIDNKDDLTRVRYRILADKSDLGRAVRHRYGTCFVSNRARSLGQVDVYIDQAARKSCLARAMLVAVGLNDIQSVLPTATGGSPYEFPTELDRRFYTILNAPEFADVHDSVRAMRLYLVYAPKK